MNIYLIQLLAANTSVGQRVASTYPDFYLTRLEEQVRHLSGDVARKADIESLKVQIEAGNTRTESVRTQIQSVRTEISDTKGVLTKLIGDKQDSATKWTIGTGAIAVTAIVALLKLLPS